MGIELTRVWRSNATPPTIPIRNSIGIMIISHNGLERFCDFIYFS
jgi:hypothetical protein